MLKRVAHSLGLVQHSDKKSRRNKQLKGGVQDLRLQSENIFVKIVHEGGLKERYQHAVPASKVMEKYPGTGVALPEVFRDPHQSVLWPEEILMPGHKYIIISCKAVEKLKRKHPEEDRTVTETKLAKEDDDGGIEKSKIEVRQQEILRRTRVVSEQKTRRGQGRNVSRGGIWLYQGLVHNSFKEKRDEREEEAFCASSSEGEILSHFGMATQALSRERALSLIFF